MWIVLKRHPLMAYGEFYLEEAAQDTPTVAADRYWSLSPISYLLRSRLCPRWL
jgi:hypothetical protein